MERTILETGKKLPEADAPSTGEISGVGQLPAPEADFMIVPIHSEDTPEVGLREFIFRSSAMRAIYGIATQVAGSDASVLVYGESGTGKELFARLLHTLSDRSSRPFVPINCGVLKGELFADKFFGHDLGAYTGASRTRKGAFEAAGSGTLFLDEVGDIPPANQVDFLRVLEERSFRRMGGDRHIPFQARIVAATNRPLPQMVREGIFRADLFYRLNVVPVQLPPLRSRTEDIRLLTEHMLHMYQRRYHRPDLVLENEVLDLFEQYHWPGNVRELRNLLERLVLLAKGPRIAVDCLPLEMRIQNRQGEGGRRVGECADNDSDPEAFTLAAAVREAEINAILRAFGRADGHKGKTAQLLGISERSLRYKVAEYKLGI